MAQVHITVANLNRITRLVAFNGVKKLDDIYESSLRDIFSVPELNLLYIFMQACESLSLDRGTDAMFERFSIIPQEKDTKTWAYEGGKPAYHLDPKCERLSQDYLNIKLPEQVVNAGDAEIKRFRAFCRLNDKLAQDNPARFLELLEAHFFLKVSLKNVHLKNSGISHFGEDNARLIKQQIDHLIDSAEVFRGRDAGTKDSIANKGFATHKVKEAKLEGHVLHTWHNKFKEPLKVALRKYFMIKFNPALSFNDSLLEQLGFNCCQQCAPNPTVGHAVKYRNEKT